MDNENNIRIIEINGVKVEVDLRTVKQVSTYKVGDNVKLLKKRYSEWQVYPGVIIDFVQFQNHPAIVVAYYENGYKSTEIEFETITSQTKEVEIAPCGKHELAINKDTVIDRFYSAIKDKQREIEDLQAKKDYFVNNFGKYFERDNKENNNGK